MTRLAVTAAEEVVIRSKAVRPPMSKPSEAEPSEPAPRSRTPAPRAISCPTVLLKFRIAPALTLTEEVRGAAERPPVRLRRPPRTVVWPT